MGNTVRELKNERDKDKREVVKRILSSYGKSLNHIASLEEEIFKKNDSINGIRSGLGNTDPSKGGGCCQEDTIINVLDEVKDLEEEIADIKAEIESVRKAIRSIDDPRNKAIVMRVWVYRSDSMRALANEYGISKDKVWRRSDVTLNGLYKKLTK